MRKTADEWGQSRLTALRPKIRRCSICETSVMSYTVVGNTHLELRSSNSQVTGRARPWTSVGEPWIVSFSWLVANGVPSIWVWYDQTFSSSLAIVRQHFGQPAVDLEMRLADQQEDCYKSQVVRWKREWIRVSAAAWVRHEWVFGIILDTPKQLVLFIELSTGH